MPQPMLNAFNGLPGIAFVPEPIEVLGHEAELDDEVAGEVLRLGLAPFLPPEAHQRCFVAAHYDPGVRPADERAALDNSVKLHCIRNHSRTPDSRRLLIFFRSSSRPVAANIAWHNVYIAKMQ